MLTGIGVVIVAGVATYQLARWALGANERELVKKREHMIQEVLKQHQKSMADLAQDIGEIAVRMEEYTAKSDRNAERLARLKSELQMFKAALATLQDREKDLEYREEQLAT
jgi:chromosome segregation ATPase